MTGQHPTTTPLGAGREFDAIRRMAARWGTRAKGLGDDAAVVELPRGDQLVTSVDSAVEGRHFRRDWLSDREIGYRAVTAALSDLAAMAAAPLGILVAMTVPERWRMSLDDLADGIGDALDVAHTVILGGNMTDGDALSITTTVLGHAFAPLRRDGARPGDDAYVTGTLGTMGAMIGLLAAGGAPPAEWRARYVAPVPRIREARWLADHGATAAIDISDGLTSELGHLAAASGTRIEVELGDIPRIDGVAARDAARSGEEYELVVCGQSLDAQAFASRFGLPLTRIGRVVEASVPGVVMLDRGEPTTVAPGHDHFTT